MKKKTVSTIMSTLLLLTALTIAVGAQQNDRIGEVIYSVPSPERDYTHGLEWDGTALWVTGAFDGMIHRFDPFTNTILASFRGPTYHLRDLAWDGVNLWVTSWDHPRNIYKLNPIDGSVVTSFPAPFSGHPDGLAWDGNYLWVGEEISEEITGKIYKVEPSTGLVVYSFSVSPEPCFNPRGLAWDGEHIWAGYQLVGLIKEHDITTGNVLTTFTSSSGGQQQGLAWDGRYLWSTGGDNYIYQINVMESISATIDIDPDTLNLNSKGRWITAYIQLPEGYDAEDIDASTILLNETIPAVLDPQYDFVTNSSEYLVDHDGDGILERMVKFDRAEVAQWIYSDLDIDYGNVTFMITGELSDGTRFEGTDKIRVLLPGDENYDGVVDISDLAMIGLAWATTPEDPRWNECCDINMDGFIGTRDLVICGNNFGKTAV